MTQTAVQALQALQNNFPSLPWLPHIRHKQYVNYTVPLRDVVDLNLGRVPTLTRGSIVIMLPCSTPSTAVYYSIQSTRHLYIRKRAVKKVGWNLAENKEFGSHYYTEISVERTHSENEKSNLDQLCCTHLYYRCPVLLYLAYCSMVGWGSKTCVQIFKFHVQQ